MASVKRKGKTRQMIPFQRIRESNDAITQITSLTPQNGCVRTTLMMRAIKDAGIDPDEPGSIEQYYLEDQGLVVFDLEG